MKQLGKVRRIWVFLGMVFALTGTLLWNWGEPWGFLVFGVVGYALLGLALFARGRTLNRSMRIIAWLEWLQVLRFLP